jgi:hypothetical protein
VQVAEYKEGVKGVTEEPMDYLWLVKGNGATTPVTTRHVGMEAKWKDQWDVL